jgi:L-ascorbate metabolism protein UlaG (beta-lactamase superfamily)
MTIDPRGAWLRTPASGLRVTWLGHSTVLIEIDGVRLLTDPVWGERASPFRLIGPRRFQPFPCACGPAGGRRGADLPRSLRPPGLPHHPHAGPAQRVPMVTSLGVGAHLEAWGVAPGRITELDWWESHRLPGTEVVVTAAPSQHFSGRGFGDRNATLWSSFAIRSPRHAVFFSGDTGLTPEYAAIRERLGPFDVVMLEIGAWHAAWGHITWDPPMRSGSRVAGRWRPSAHPLGHLQPGHARLGRAGRDLAVAGGKPRSAAVAATTRRGRRAEQGGSAAGLVA